MNWRLDSWKNPYSKIEKSLGTEVTWSEYPDFDIYEAGADAMLESFLILISNERLCPRRVANDIKLFIGAVPDEDVA